VVISSQFINKERTPITNFFYLKILMKKSLTLQIIRNISSSYHKSTVERLNRNVLEAQYAVRGLVPMRAAKIREELVKRRRKDMLHTLL
jgi:hypothetical protein